jgi:hypothetical protein
MKTKTIKVAEATNLQLDWLVWKCAGGTAAYPKTASGKAFLKLWNGNTAKYVHPTTDWGNGGPIFDRCPEMQLWPWGGEPDERAGELQCACMPTPLAGGSRHQTWFGKTKLIAAARCYVASKLGDTVEVPEELS